MMFANAEELMELTNARRCDAQAKALRHMKIEHRIRPDGSIAVLKDHLLEVFGKKTRTMPHKRKEPNFEGINSHA